MGDVIKEVVEAEKGKPRPDLGETLAQVGQTSREPDAVQIASRISPQWDSDTQAESALASHRKQKQGAVESGDASSGNESPQSRSNLRRKGPIERRQEQESARKFKTLSEMDCPTEEKLIRAYLFDNRALHIRRTLDQFYYHTLKSTATRDSSQVLSRYTEKLMDKKLVFMIHQLWLWVLDEGSSRKAPVSEANS